MKTWVFPKKQGDFTTKMDGENKGKAYEQMDDLGGKNHYFWKHPYVPGNSAFMTLLGPRDQKLNF